MPHPTTLSADELERMRASVSPPVQSDREARRQAIKLKSEQRTATWPNTLEAMRKKKDRWKKDKEERLEEERKKIDEEEMRLQRDAQTKQIERANRLLYEQTDRMKTLRSKQLLADVVHHRTLQLEEKQMLKDQDDLTNYLYDRQVLAKVLEGEEEERRLRKKNQDDNARLAAIQKGQLEEYKQRYINELREEKMDGERMKQQAEQEYLDEMEKERQRKLRLKQASEEAQLANQRLRAHREMLKEKERLEDVKREEEERKKQLRDAKRINLQRQKKENAQARKQRMIDLATNNLVKLEQKNEERLQNQSKEVRAKEDKVFKERADRRAAEKEAIARSRRHQLDCKQREKELAAEEALESVIQWEQFGRRIEMQVKQEEQERRLEDLRLAVEQKQQADARCKTIADERSARLQDDQDARRALEYENERFKVVAQQALDEARERGLTNVFPIQKALAEKRVDLLHAAGFRV
ncbi:Coiled-coil domain-containing protein [Phytophthora cinnamomi]|uniref:Coiled-coil domain-containing protein n=1 Tax=Phytophthora cinnamomi TaxID=4785 RepID=UPI00355AB5A3|nr:Coiled-coil domain-containing protein [Phytophthora cinnamomi]